MPTIVDPAASLTFATIAGTDLISSSLYSNNFFSSFFSLLIGGHVLYSHSHPVKARVPVLVTKIPGDILQAKWLNRKDEWMSDFSETIYSQQQHHCVAWDRYTLVLFLIFFWWFFFFFLRYLHRPSCDCFIFWWSNSFDDLLFYYCTWSLLI